MVPAAFGRLCVETAEEVRGRLASDTQPPSGGCVLKRRQKIKSVGIQAPAAFGRLCVETGL